MLTPVATDVPPCIRSPKALRNAVLKRRHHSNLFRETIDGMAAEQDEIQEQDTQEAKPSLGAALAPLDVVEVELVSVSASPLQSAGWAKLTQAGATLRVCRGDSVVRTVRPAPATQGTTATHMLQLPCSLTPAHVRPTPCTAPPHVQIRTTVLPREGDAKVGYHIAFRHTTQLCAPAALWLFVASLLPTDAPRHAHAGSWTKALPCASRCAAL